MFHLATFFLSFGRKKKLQFLHFDIRGDTWSGVLTRMSHSLHFSFTHSYYCQKRTCVRLKHFGPQQSKLLMPCWQPVNSHQLLLELLWEFVGRHLQMLYQYRFTSAEKGQTASLVAAMENALFFLLAKEKALESKWIAGRQLRNCLGWKLKISGKEWSFRNCNSFPIFTCNQAAHLQRKLSSCSFIQSLQTAAWLFSCDFKPWYF